MSVTLRLLTNIKEWTYNMLYSICWALVLQGFTQTNHQEHAHWPGPIPAYFDIIPALTIRTKSQKNVFIRICGRWERSHFTIYASTQKCLDVLKRTSTVQTIDSIFTCTNKLEYINYHFSAEKGGVRINRAYELLEILQYKYKVWSHKFPPLNYFKTNTKSGELTPEKFHLPQTQPQIGTAATRDSQGTLHHHATVV